VLFAAWNIRPLHESVAHGGAPKARRLLRDRRSFLVGDPGHRLDQRRDGEHVLLQGTVVADMLTLRTQFQGGGGAV